MSQEDNKERQHQDIQSEQPHEELDHVNRIQGSLQGNMQKIINGEIMRPKSPDHSPKNNLKNDWPHVQETSAEIDLRYINECLDHSEVVPVEIKGSGSVQGLVTGKHGDSFIVRIRGKNDSMVVHGARLRLLAHPDIPLPGFRIGQTVKVERSDGRIENGWVIQEQHRDGTFHVAKLENGGKITKDVTREGLEHWSTLSTLSPQERTALRIPFDVGEEVYVVRGNKENGVAERGWFVQKLPDGTRILSRGDIEKLFDPDRIAHIYEVETMDRDPGTMPRQKGFELQRRKYEILEKKVTLSKEEFSSLFTGELKQQNVGNCYLIAALNSLKHSPHFEAIMRTAIRADGKNGYIVTVPLGGGQPREEIAISIQDLQAQRVNPAADLYERSSLRPVQGAMGWQILEAVYIKLQTGGRMNRAMIDGGRGHEALQTFFGNSLQNNSFGKSNRVSLSMSGNREKTEAWLDTFHNGKDIATAGSKVMHGQSDRKTYKIQTANGPITINYNHAYSIESVDKFTKTVILKNPHDTSKPLTFTYQEFFDTFVCVDAVQIDAHTLFQTP